MLFVPHCFDSFGSSVKLLWHLWSLADLASFEWQKVDEEVGLRHQLIMLITQTQSSEKLS